MARINLRPWREELRAEKQRSLVVMLMGTVIIAGGLVFLWQAHVDSQIDYQQARNSYIERATTALDQQIKEIEQLRERREELLARMQVIQDLQGKRPVIVRVFDELVQTLPDGLFYAALKKTNDQLVIEGMAESNNRISALLRQFDSSQWFADPDLKKVRAADTGRAGYSKFDMTVVQKAPETEAESKK